MCLAGGQRGRRPVENPADFLKFQQVATKGQ